MEQQKLKRLWLRYVAVVLPLWSLPLLLTLRFPELADYLLFFNIVALIPLWLITPRMAEIQERIRKLKQQIAEEEGARKVAEITARIQSGEIRSNPRFR